MADAATDPFAGYAQPGDVPVAAPVDQDDPFAGYAMPPASAAPAPYVPPVSEKDDPTLFERFSDTIADASLSITDTLANVSGLDSEHMDGVEGVERQISGKEAALQLAGGAVGGVAGIAGDVFMEGLSHTPEIIKDEAARAGRAFAETTAGQKVLDYAAEGGAKWEAYKKAHPQNAKNIGAALEVGMLILPGASKAVQKSGTKMLNKGLRQRVSKTEQMLAPDKKIRTRDSGGETTYNKWGTREFAPGIKGQEVAKEVATVKNFNPNGIAGKGYEAVNKSAQKLAQSLDDDIIKAGNPQINKQVFLDDLFKTVDDFHASDDAIMIGKDSTAIAQDMLYKVHDMVEQTDGSARALLQVRRDFDDWVTEHGGKAFNPTEINGRNVAQKLVRDKINKTVDEMVPDAKVHEKLRRQHLQLTARDRLYDKMHAEGQNVWERAVKGLSGAGHVGPVGALTIAGSLGSGLGIVGGGLTAPALAAGAAAGALTYGAFRGWNSATRRKVLGTLIQSAGTSRADKLILIDMLSMDENQPQAEENVQ